jgi:hypothetical protein
MRIDLHPEHLAAVFVPQPGDDPEDLEDVIHDEILKGREDRAPDEKPRVVNVILQLDEVAQPAVWLKACGPQIPDVNLRIVLGGPGYAAARALGLTALFEWYQSVDAALRQGV